MYKIVSNEDLAPGFHLLEFAAPAVAKKAQAGQFVIIRIDETGERIPLTIADWDRDEGTITVVFMEVGKTTRKLATLKAGDSIANLAGPLGLPTRIENYGTVVCVAGCFHIGAVMPIARALKEAGNRVISIIETASTEVLFWDDRLGRVSDKLIVTTRDGSSGRSEWVADVLRELLETAEKVDLVVTIGPAFMMKHCATTTERFGVKTIVGLGAIMVDGTGMCGCCRVTVGGVTKFACVDGPEFDGHQVNWDELLARQRTYLDEERISLEEWERLNDYQSRTGVWRHCVCRD